MTDRELERRMRLSIRVHALDLMLRRVLAGAMRFSSEAELQQEIRHRLEAAHVVFRAEHRLSQTDRIDFLVTDGHVNVGIEVKVKGTLADLERQVARYLEHEELDGLLVFTTRYSHTPLGEELLVNNKPLRVIFHIASAFG